MLTVEEKVAELTRERDHAKALLASREDEVRRLRTKCSRLDNAIDVLDEPSERPAFPGKS